MRLALVGPNSATLISVNPSRRSKILGESS
jgi:hypothetical protein